MENKNETSGIEMYDVEIGEDAPQVAAKRVVIERIEIVKVTFGNEDQDKLVLKVKHPDVPDLVEISRVKYNKADKLEESGTWLKKDKDGKLFFKSAVASLLRYLKKNKISELKGEQIDTLTDKNGYLMVKAY